MLFAVKTRSFFILWNLKGIYSLFEIKIIFRFPHKKIIEPLCLELRLIIPFLFSMTHLSKDNIFNVTWQGFKNSVNTRCTYIDNFYLCLDAQPIHHAFFRY